MTMNDQPLHTCSPDTTEQNQAARVPADRDITFVVQGAVYPGTTQEVIDSVRRHFPESPIVFSSTTPQEQAGLTGVDIYQANADPGDWVAQELPDRKPSNCNRQIVNTREGLRHAATPYAFKLRSDMPLTGRGFLDYFDAFPARDEYTIFSHRILACCWFSRNPRSSDNLPFHLSDLAFFGLTSDLLSMYDIPLMSRQDALFRPKRCVPSRMVAEQYIFVSALAAHGRQVSLRDYKDSSSQNIALTERLFASNFAFLDFDQLSIAPTRDYFILEKHPAIFRTCYTHLEWRALYDRFLLPPGGRGAADSAGEGIAAARAGQAGGGQGGGGQGDSSVATDPVRARISAAYRSAHKIKVAANLLSALAFPCSKPRRDLLRDRLIEKWGRK
ncbi:hypothetical protein FACS1894186_1310 [Alphaproteobacteria bacterium]|nr:hypothetical protein FACS1894186_1310 [Alphaproteobacteria bacterium]